MEVELRRSLRRCRCPFAKHQTVACGKTAGGSVVVNGPFVANDGRTKLVGLIETQCLILRPIAKTNACPKHRAFVCLGDPTTETSQSVAEIPPAITTRRLAQTAGPS